MKYFKLVPIVLLTVLMSCTGQESANTFDSIAYKAHTRGTSISITVNNAKAVYNNNKEEKSVDLSEEQINQLNAVIGKLNLSEINALKSPSEERVSDGALIANFVIKKADKEYTSANFDAGNPPEELKQLETLLINYFNLEE